MKTVSAINFPGEERMPSPFYITGNFDSLLYKKRYRGARHCGGKGQIVAFGDLPQAENPAKQDSFL